MSPTKLGPIIAAAEDYARRGLSVIPTKADKKPAVRSWKMNQTTAARPEDVRGWFERVKSTTGVGIILGAVSGHLYVRDFDDPDEYERWRAAHSDLAARLPTVKTRRGFHVYARWEDVKTATMPGGELRGNGAYVLAPPSRNADGGVYAWVVPLPVGLLPEVDPYTVGLAVAKSQSQVYATESTEKTERTEKTEKIEDTEAIWGDSDSRSRIEAAITRTSAKNFATRNNAVFNFARALHAIPRLHDIPAANVLRLKPIVRVWYERALPHILTKDWGITWGDFVHAWGGVRFPEGSDILAKALSAAQIAEPPPWSEEYSPACRLLGSLCRELQRFAGAAPFFLSAINAGNCVGADKSTAAKWLKAFTADQKLELVCAGTAQSRRASRYRYVAADLYPARTSPEDATGVVA